jgi:serine protease inhibitor
MTARTLVLCFVALLASRNAPSQEGSRSVLADFLRANEQAGLSLLIGVQKAAPTTNHVISPLSLSLLFAAIDDATVSDKAHHEISRTFGWSRGPELRTVGRMLMIAFEGPHDSPAISGDRSANPPLAPVPGTWIRNVLEYKGQRTFSSSFLATAEKYFGVTATSTGTRAPAPGQDFLLKSDTLLWTRWSGNTFEHQPRPAPFHAPSGPVTVSMMTSETTEYRHAKTSEFEAVVVPCTDASLTLILPAVETDLVALAQRIVSRRLLVGSLLRPETGTVQLPMIHLATNYKLLPYFEEKGMHEVVRKLGGIVDIPGSRIGAINQAVTLEIDRAGIRAEARTGVLGIYGGIRNAAAQFHTTFDRPFLFLINDSTVGALLFAGVVLDPTHT